MIKKIIDKKNKFISIFDTNTGMYMRTGVLTDEGVDTGEDVFMTDFPELIDIGIMGKCLHGISGLCEKSGVQCYQNGPNTNNENMSLEDFKSIIDQCENKTYQVALGGRGDVDQHENFREILEYCRSKQIVPSFTSSGLGFTEEIAKTCKDLCGAVAISWYRQQHTLDAINMLLKEGVTTSIHYVLGKNSIDEAIERLKNDDFPDGITAVVFLLHKPIGLGTLDNVLDVNDPKLVEFFDLVDNKKHKFKIGFDSCTIPGVINHTKNINPDSIDTCEAARWSMYIDSNMIAIPCSFDNQTLKWGVDLKKHSIKEAWDSQLFENFRNYHRGSCPSCKDRNNCYGGCPISREIVLCSRDSKELIV